jgi:hypothetical protein
MAQAGAKLKTCELNVYNKPDYASIRPHLLLPGNPQPTMAQLSDDTRPTENEGHLLINYFDELMPCRQAFIEKTQHLAPVIVPIQSEAWAESDQVTLKLSKREITWGQAAQLKQQIIVVAQKNLNSAAQAQMSLNAQQQAADAQSTQARAAMLQAMRPEPIQRTTTNCQMIGGTLNCNSY